MGVKAKQMFAFYYPITIHYSPKRGESNIISYFACQHTQHGHKTPGQTVVTVERMEVGVRGVGGKKVNQQLRARLVALAEGN